MSLPGLGSLARTFMMTGGELVEHYPHWYMHRLGVEGWCKLEISFSQFLSRLESYLSHKQSRYYCSFVTLDVDFTFERQMKLPAS